MRNVSFKVPRGITLGLVGESGSGKTTLGRAVLGLSPVTHGTVLFDGEDVLSMDRVALRAFRGRAQLVFQNAADSLNPRRRVGETLEEVQGVDENRRADRAAELLVRVGLPTAAAKALPHQLSGGQQQRVVIARALAVDPEFLVLDEPVSALDVSVQAQIVNLLLELQQALALSYLFISHDIALVRRVSDRILVMQGGELVESGDPDMVVQQPKHPYTRTLVAAAFPTARFRDG